LDWKKIYEERKCTAEEAVKEIKSKDRVVFAHCIGEPTVLVDAMVKNAHNYKDVTISHMVTFGKGEYTDPKYAENFRWEGWFAGGPTRKCIEMSHGDYVPAFFHEVPSLIRKKLCPVDVMMAMVSPPDEHGFCSVGVSSDYTMEGIRSAKKVLVEVNPNMPVIYGDTFVHVSRFDKIVEVDYPLTEVPMAKIGEVEESIVKYCASLIEDGSTLQLGIGAIPDAVLYQLKDKKDLGIHSEMISDGVVDLFQTGAITGAKKTIHKGKMLVTFLMGTKKLYDFVEKNPLVEMRTVDYVNDPTVIMQNHKMVSINSCLQVDFIGQVVSDTIGTKQFSGVGGQVDFVRGASMSLDGKGKAIIAMPSTTTKKDGTMISKIVPYIDHGAAVTTSRNDVDYIITEYGIAHLKGKSLRERARSLIKIAHPDVREELKKAFNERFNTPCDI